MVKVVHLTNSILQYCLVFTISVHLYPLWTQVRGKYYAGKNCLFSNDWASCVNASLIVNNENVTLSVKGTLSKFLVARLSTFHICEDILDKFLKKEIRTITSRNMGDNSCLVLPSFKHASVHEISYDVPDFCPLSDASDMSTYWFDYHGFNIPCDNKIFVTLSFNFPNAPRMTYPYYCIRKGYPILKQSTQVLAIKEFVSNLNICFNEKILGLKLEFPTEAVFPTIPSDSMECVTVNTPSNLDTAPLAIPTENTSINLFTALKDVSSMKEMKITKESSAKIMPRFTPYKRPTKHVTNSVVTESNNKTIKPNFQHLVKAPAPSWNFPTPTTSAHSIKPQFSQKQPDKPNFSHKPGPKAKRVPSPCQAKAKLPAKPSLRIPSSLKTPLKSPSLSQKNLKTPLKSPRFSQPTNYNSPSFSDEDDDFEAAMFSIGAALSPSTNKPTVNEIRFNKAKSSPAPKLMSAPATPLSKPKPTPSASPATPSTKARNKPVILTSDQVMAKRFIGKRHYWVNS